MSYYQREDCWDWPKGWFARDRGWRSPDVDPLEAVWATGNQYLRDGNAPNRVEILSFHNGIAYVTYEWVDRLKSATQDQIDKTVRSLERYNTAEVVRLELQIKQLESHVDLWKRRSEEGPAGPSKK